MATDGQITSEGNNQCVPQTVNLCPNENRPEIPARTTPPWPSVQPAEPSHTHAWALKWGHPR